MRLTKNSVKDRTPPQSGRGGPTRGRRVGAAARVSGAARASRIRGAAEVPSGEREEWSGGQTEGRESQERVRRVNEEPFPLVRNFQQRALISTPAGFSVALTG